MLAYQAFAAVYDQLMADMPYDDWLRFTREFWKRHGSEPKTVAELGCGTGNITIPLAESGLDVTGIDLSSSMLTVAQEKSESLASMRAGRLRYVEQDMREWELGENVEGVLSYCDSMNYLTDVSDLAMVFSRTWDALKHGGWFLFDMHTPYTLLTYDRQQPFVLQDDDISYIWTCEFDEQRCELTHALSLFVRNALGTYDRVDEWHTQRAYEARIIKDLLHQAGFVDIQHFADFSFKRPGPRSRRWFFAARKPVK